MHTIRQLHGRRVLVTNREGEVVLCNSTSLQLLGVQSRRLIQDRCRPMSATADFQVAIESLLAGGNPGEARVYRPSSAKTGIHLRGLVGPVSGPDSQVLGTGHRIPTTSPTSKNWMK